MRSAADLGGGEASGAGTLLREEVLFPRASLDGFTLHAATRAGALDTAGREALLRYILRGRSSWGRSDGQCRRSGTEVRAAVPNDVSASQARTRASAAAMKSMLARRWVLPASVRF
jgi:hypothetical protein